MSWLWLRPKAKQAKPTGQPSQAKSLGLELAFGRPGLCESQAIRQAMALELNILREITTL